MKEKYVPRKVIQTTSNKDVICYSIYTVKRFDVFPFIRT